jgi:hypothetical protein
MCKSEAPTQAQSGNKPPQFILPPSIEVIEGSPVSFTVSVSEPDGDAVTTSAIRKPQGSVYSDSSRQFAWQTSKFDRGTTQIIFSVSDGHYVVYDTVLVTVKPQGNHPPVFASITGPFTAYPNQQYTLQISTTNPATDSVTVTAVSYPAGSQLTAPPFSGTLLFKYTPLEKDTGSSIKVIFSAANSSAITYDTVTLQVQRLQNIAVGMWTVTQDGQTIALVINANQTFTIDYAGLLNVSGTCVVSGTTVTLTPVSCTVLGQSSTDCGDPAIGTISGNQMTMPNGDGTSTILTKGQNSSVNALGEWRIASSGLTMTINVYADYTFVMNATGLYHMSGTYTLSDSSITFTYSACTVLGQPSTSCGGPDTGVISGNQLTISYSDGTSASFTRVIGSLSKKLTGNFFFSRAGKRI